MKERPILFSAPIIRALLEGRKTVTRRTMKQATGPSLSVEMLKNGQALHSWLVGHGLGYEVGEQLKFVNCLNGRPGDRLWVRETFAWGLCTEQPYAYRATLAPEDLQAGWHDPIKWKPSIHMPRAASRILLEVTDVRVERLQDISEEQALAEGIEARAIESYRAAGVERPAKFAFRDLWTSINGTESWEANPWVWCVSFGRV